MTIIPHYESAKHLTIKSVCGMEGDEDVLYISNQDADILKCYQDSCHCISTRKF